MTNVYSQRAEGRDMGVYMSNGRRNKNRDHSNSSSIFPKGENLAFTWPASQHQQNLGHQSTSQEATGATLNLETHMSGLLCYSQEVSVGFSQHLPLWGVEMMVTRPEAVTGHSSWVITSGGDFCAITQPKGFFRVVLVSKSSLFYSTVKQPQNPSSGESVPV